MNSSSPSSTALPSAIDSSILPSADDLSTSISADFLASSWSTVGHGTGSPEASFAAASAKCQEVEVKVKPFIDAFQVLSGDEIFADGFCNRLTEWSKIFQSDLEGEPERKTQLEIDAGRRLRRLEEVYPKIKQSWASTRLWLVFITHEVEYISQWEDIDRYTSRGVDAMSAALRIATKYLKQARYGYKRGKKLVQVMREGGPAFVLEDGGLPQSTWDHSITMDNIKELFTYIKKNNPNLHELAETHNWEVSTAIISGFMDYGWTQEELLDSRTKVMSILEPYLAITKPHADSMPGQSELRYKRRRVDPFGTSYSLPDHDTFLPNFLGLGRDGFDQALPARRTVQPMLGSNFSFLPSSDERDRRNLIDDATVVNLSKTVSGPDELTDLATMSNLRSTIPSPSHWTVEERQGSDNFPSTDICHQGAASASQRWDNFVNGISSLPTTSTPFYIDPRMMSDPMADVIPGRRNH